MDNNTQNTPTSSQDSTKEGTKKDILMGILSYLGILCLIPYLTKKDDSFVRFHAKQGLVLFILWLGITILRAVILPIFIFSGLLNTINIFFSLLYLGIFLYSVWGIVLVVQGKEEELPFLGVIVKKLNL